MMIKGTQEDTTNMWPEHSVEETDKKNFVKKWEDTACATNKENDTIDATKKVLCPVKMKNTKLDTFLCTFDDTDCFGKVAFLKNNKHVDVLYGKLYVIAENMESVIRKYPETIEIKKLGPGDYII